MIDFVLFRAAHWNIFQMLRMILAPEFQVGWIAIRRDIASDGTCRAALRMKRVIVSKWTA
jgi:hypothetical protein